MAMGATHWGQDNVVFLLSFLLSVMNNETEMFEKSVRIVFKQQWICDYGLNERSFAVKFISKCNLYTKAWTNIKTYGRQYLYI